MRYFPINLDVQGRKVLVVGGGKIAWRKVRSLLECGAEVTVISPEMCPELAELKGITRVDRAYRAGDIAGAWLVISATDSETVNRRVWKAAAAAAVPCNVVDQPELCSFTIPAVLSEGDLMITISTGGISPALAGRLRQQLQQELNPVYARHLKLLGEIRTAVKKSGLSPRERARLLKAMAAEEISRIIARDGEEGGRRQLREMLATALHAADKG